MSEDAAPPAKAGIAPQKVLGIFALGFLGATSSEKRPSNFPVSSDQPKNGTSLSSVNGH